MARSWRCDLIPMEIMATTSSPSMPIVQISRLLRWLLDQLNYQSPGWSPGGTKIAMMSIQTPGDPYYNTRICVMNSNGSGITTIISGGAIGTKISWSPDGTDIAYTSLFGSRNDISWVSADGSASGTIVTNGWNADWQH